MTPDALHVVDFISIHAPRVRCDLERPIGRGYPDNFNPRTSCEVRRVQDDWVIDYELFQSTHLV